MGIRSYLEVRFIYLEVQSICNLTKKSVHVGLHWVNGGIEGLGFRV